MRTMVAPRRLLLRLVPALVAIAVGLPAIDGEFVRDDWLYVVTNPHVIAPVSLHEMFSEPFQPDNELGLYRPVTTLSFRVDLILSLVLTGKAPHPVVFHLTNLLLAAAAAVLVFELGRRLGLGEPGAFAAALLFAAHPGRGEAVLWISGRAENLMTAGSLAALVLAAGPRFRGRPFLVFATTLLAFLSKEQAAVVPILVFLLPVDGLRARLRAAAPAALAVGGGVLVRALVLRTLGPKGAQQVMGEFGFGSRVLHGLAFLGDYARLALWPHPLRNEYDDPAPTVPVAPLAMGLIVAAGLALSLLRRKPRATFGLALFVLPLAPVLNVVWRTGESFAERFLALPVAGVALALALPSLRVARLALLPLVLALPGALVFFDRARDFADERTLYEAQLADAPEAGASSWLLASHLNAADPARGGDPAARDPALVRRILELADEGVRRAPHATIARLEYAKHLTEFARAPGNGQVNLNALREAEKHAREAIRLSPHLAEPYGVLGQVLALFGRVDEAAEAFTKALAVEPRDTRAATFLVQIHERRGETDQRVRLLERMEAVAREAAAQRPWDHQPWQLRSAVAFQLGRAAECPGFLEEALRRVRTPDLLVTVGRMLHDVRLRLGDAAAAEAVYDRIDADLVRFRSELRPQDQVRIAHSQLMEFRARYERAAALLTEALPFARSAAHRARLAASIAALEAKAPR